ncbi:MAG: glycosyltransferase, partial [Chloroflexota bacterium]
MKIVAIAGSRIPSDTANSIQVMKACQALVQLGHNLTLLVPGPQPANLPTLNLQQIYGLQTGFPIEWMDQTHRRLFTLSAVLRARALEPNLLYVWLPQSAVFGLLARMTTVFEIHIQPSGFFGPFWHRAFAALPGRKRLACITESLQRTLEGDFRMRMRAQDVILAPNGVELERFASLPDPETARRLIGLPSASTILCAGHLYTG